MMTDRALPIAVLLAALCLGGCAAAPSLPVVTITRTVSEPAVGPPAPTAAAAPRRESSAAPGPGDAGSGEIASDSGVPVASAVPEVPGKPVRTGPPTTIVVGRPTIPDPAKGTPSGTAGPEDTGNGTGSSAGDAESASSSPDAATGSTQSPPGSLSTDGDLIAAATSAAAAAGVAPADPDAPGPDSGPPCPAAPSYVDEATTGLRSDVARAWEHAVARAADEGITMCLNDGKRSRAQQQAQYDAYVEQYGTDVADQLVLQPNKSAHVVGIAVDVQPADAYRWLQSTGGALGFCRIYDNEAWHFEFNPDYRSTGCPPRLPEPER